MNYMEVRIETNRAGTEVLTALLEDLAAGFVVEDPQDLQDLMEAPSPRWDYIDERLVAQNRSETVSLRFYLDDSEQGRLYAQEAKARVENLASRSEGALGPLSLCVQPVRSEDWENNWKQYYKPFSVGERLLVRPSWEQAEPTPGQQVLVMDPASSFGTGSHATTRLCLEALEQMDLAGRHMLDAGCGSGILAIAGLLLGAQDAQCCDVEPGAVKATRENLAQNGIDLCRYQVYQGDFLADPSLAEALSARRYGVITANIVADVLLAMAPSLCAWLEEEGDLLLSGIIDERAQEVLQAYLELGMQVRRQTSRDGWTLLHLGHKS